MKRFIVAMIFVLLPGFVLADSKALPKGTYRMTTIGNMTTLRGTDGTRIRIKDYGNVTRITGRSSNGSTMQGIWQNSSPIKRFHVR